MQMATSFPQTEAYIKESQKVEILNEGLSGSWHMACLSRDIGNLGDPISSLLKGKSTDEKRG